jgi:uridine kinase
MNRAQVLEELANQITQIERTHPTRVAIDGPDAAGKTRLADELVPLLQAHGRQVIRVSIDGFHNPTHIRYQRENATPEGYYRDSFNYAALSEVLLKPLGRDGSCQYRTAVFDYRTDSEVQKPPQLAQANAILLFDGVFLLRPELLKHWDFTIFVDASFEVTLARVEQRDTSLFGSKEEVRQRYKQRYIPGQQLYFAERRPKELADVVIDNNDPANPIKLSRAS